MRPFFRSCAVIEHRRANSCRRNRMSTSSRRGRAGMMDAVWRFHHSASRHEPPRCACHVTKFDCSAAVRLHYDGCAFCLHASAIGAGGFMLTWWLGPGGTWRVLPAVLTVLVAATILASGSSRVQAQQQTCQCAPGSFSPLNNGQCFDQFTFVRTTPVCTSTNNFDPFKQQRDAERKAEFQKSVDDTSARLAAEAAKAAQDRRDAELGRDLIMRRFGFDPRIPNYIVPGLSEAELARIGHFGNL